jgi:hypothetical protein
MLGPEIFGTGIDNHPVLSGPAGSQPQKDESSRTAKDFLQHSAAPFYELPRLFIEEYQKKIETATPRDKACNKA